jgi:hypothetical protein
VNKDSTQATVSSTCSSLSFQPTCGKCITLQQPAQPLGNNQGIIILVIMVDDGDNAKNIRIWETWQPTTKHWMIFLGMNEALLKHIIFLLPTEHRTLYNITLILNQNGTFQDTFNYSYKECSAKDEVELESSRNNTKYLWNSAEGFELLQKCFDNENIHTTC